MKELVWRTTSFSLMPAVDYMTNIVIRYYW